jgi:GT2 family glycosyltransferase
MRLRVPHHDDPLVTLVMVVYGRYELARATLSTLADTIDVPAEVLVVDNASPDGAGRRLAEETDGARFLLQDTNLGYGVAIDVGAMEARGAYVGILNSDLEFASSWLSPLVDALDGDPTLGAAVPLYVDPAGSVLGAGGLVGEDGEGYLYGLGAAADDPAVGFSRRVDYGPAAALLVRRDAFDRVGGFDPAYGLGYYEDNDLGFALREAGFHTRYVPTSRVRHASGGTFGRALHAEQVARNRPLFTARHAAALRGRPRISRPPFDPHRELVLRDWWADDRVLLLDRGGRLSALAAGLAALAPDALVTWVDEAPPPPGARATGVEWVGGVRRLDRWLEARRFHYSAVVLVGAPGGDVDGLLDRTQPQARRGRWDGEAHWPDIAVAPDASAAGVLDRLGVTRR